MTPTEFRAARHSLDLTQQATADLLGVKLDAVSRWEADPADARARAVNPTAARVMRWMCATDRPAEWPGA